jgi:hypothetical protein
MNENLFAMKFLLWGGGIALAITGTVSLTKATYRMAEAAVKIQTQNQFSHGSFSRMLWSGHSTKAKHRKTSR